MTKTQPTPVQPSEAGTSREQEARPPYIEAEVPIDYGYDVKDLEEDLETLRKLGLIPQEYGTSAS